MTKQIKKLYKVILFILLFFIKMSKENLNKIDKNQDIENKEKETVEKIQDTTWSISFYTFDARPIDYAAFGAIGNVSPLNSKLVFEKETHKKNSITDITNALNSLMELAFPRPGKLNYGQICEKTTAIDLLTYEKYWEELMEEIIAENLEIAKKRSEMISKLCESEYIIDYGKTRILCLNDFYKTNIEKHIK